MVGEKKTYIFFINLFRGSQSYWYLSFSSVQFIGYDVLIQKLLSFYWINWLKKEMFWATVIKHYIVFIEVTIMFLSLASLMLLMKQRIKWNTWSHFTSTLINYYMWAIIPWSTSAVILYRDWWQVCVKWIPSHDFMPEMVTLDSYFQR